MKTARLALSAVALVGLLLQAPAALAAGTTSSDTMQGRVDAVIATFGGTQTGPNEVTWDGGAIILDLAPDAGTPVQESATVLAAAATVGGCVAGSHCIYSAANYAGDKVSFSGCSTSESVALLDGAVRSVANSTTSSTVKVYDGTTVLATAAAGVGKNVTGTATKVSCS